MPHKRAKRSARESARNQKGQDLAPSKDDLSKEPIPKGIARVLNAEKIREEWKIRKRKLEEADDPRQSDKRRKLDDDARNSKRKTKEAQAMSNLKIKPGESIQHFNRRVEDDMRPLVKAAAQSANAVARSAQRAEKEAKAKKSKTSKEDKKGEAKPTRTASPASSPVSDKLANKAVEFQTHSSSAPRRLNDIAQAPPEFKSLPRGAGASGQGGGGKREGVLSMAQKQMMENEREIAIAKYRGLRARQRQLNEKIGDGDA
ncbi:hypothetical protein LshimejAT787_2100920 [Lyophyllum shimeji]|uniref:Uncharacterized protein n=1 Tax=Lyophyllum shimeji TaxID=47721 RepID=A0A9P3Q1Z0_LYOSH|nr:hypothetical protein LshimejAT787_2100920 [Lyophyllum shimeji]